MAVKNDVKAMKLLTVAVADQFNIMMHRGLAETEDVTFEDFLGFPITLWVTVQKASDPSKKGPLPGQDVIYYLYLGDEYSKNRFTLSSTAQPHIELNGKVIDPDKVQDFLKKGYRDVIHGKYTTASVLGFAADAVQRDISHSSDDSTELNTSDCLMSAYKGGVVVGGDDPTLDALACNAICDLYFNHPDDLNSQVNDISDYRDVIAFYAQRSQAGADPSSLVVRVDPHPEHTPTDGREFVLKMECSIDGMPTGTYNINGVVKDASELAKISTPDGPPLHPFEFNELGTEVRAAYLYRLLPRVLARYNSDPREAILECINRGDLVVDYGKAYQCLSD